MPQAELWQLVAVSLNVCPKQDKTFADYDVFLRHAQYADRKVRRRFVDRLEVAVEHVRVNTLPANINASYPYVTLRFLNSLDGHRIADGNFRSI